MTDAEHSSMSTKARLSTANRPTVTQEMVKQARLVQGRQRIGTHGDYNGELRDDDTLLFYADTEEQVGEMLRAALESKP